MYGNSAEFESAIRAKRPQHALLVFPSSRTYLTERDLDAESGIHYSEVLNGDTELTMGAAVRSEISIGLISDDKMLSDLDFTSEFTAWLGVEMGEMAAAIDAADVVAGAQKIMLLGGKVLCLVENVIHYGSATYTLSEVPAALVALEGVLYALGKAGNVLACYQIGDALTAFTAEHTRAMLLNFEEWAQDKATIAFENGSWRRFKGIGESGGEWDGAQHLTWNEAAERTWDTLSPAGTSIRYDETRYVPLGVFKGERPLKIETQIIDVEAQDRMQRFEIDAYEWLNAMTFPITLQEMFESLCTYCGVPYSYENGRVFLNGDKTFESAPMRGTGTTCREVLSWIAEASCAYARMRRTGECELVWLEDVDYTVWRTDRFTLDLAEYEVAPINRLQVHVTESDVGVLVPETAPSDTNGYAIIDNPYLYGTTDASIRPWAENIYRKLIDEGLSHRPMVVEAECNWAIQGGDVIRVEDDEGVVHRMPVYAQTISWNGNAEVTYESTGSAKRGEMTQSNREKLVDGYSKFELKKTVEGLEAEIYTIDSTTGERVSKFKLTADELELMLKKSELITSINADASGLKILSPHIALEGLTTVNNNFKVLADGSIEAVNGKFGGTLESGNWKFNASGSTYTNGSMGVNMTVMSGDFVGGGSGTRAFFGSSGMDVQYGSDYNCNTYIRSGKVIVVAQNPNEMSEYGTAEFVRSDSGQLSFVCGESEGASTTDTNAKGNLGLATKYWDYTFTRVLRAGTYPGSSSRAIKQDIEELPEMGEMLDKLTPVSFAYKNDPGKTRYGLIYEDTEKVMPVICFDDGQGDPGIVYTDLIAPLLKEIQSLRRRVSELERKEE